MIPKARLIHLVYRLAMGSVSFRIALFFSNEAAISGPRRWLYSLAAFAVFVESINHIGRLLRAQRDEQTPQ